MSITTHFQKMLVNVSAALLFYSAVFVFDAATNNGFTALASESLKVDHLADESSDPYRLFGKRPTDRRRQDAARKWPNVRSCLKPLQQQVEIPDLAEFDWSAMETEADVEVCIYRIVSSLNDNKMTDVWFKSQGIEKSEQTADAEYTEYTWLIRSFWSPQRFYIKRNNYFISKILINAHFFSVIRRNNELIGISVFSGSPFIRF